MFRLVDATNEFIASSEPWALAKQGKDDDLDGVLADASDALRTIAILLAPVMPSSAEEILRRIGAPVAALADLRLDDARASRMVGERQIQRGGVLWPRIEAAAGADAPAKTPKEIRVSEQPPILPTTGTGPGNPASPVSPDAASPVVSAPVPAAPVPAAPADTRISIDDFMKIDLRVARVLTAERVPNSKKLMKMTIEVGAETRTIVAGIAEAYEADALVGRHVAIVANLKPAKLMGIESNGMVLAASPDGGKPMLVAFDQPPPPGTRVR